MRGRPLKSIIRQNIVEILYFSNPMYGYEIFKVYNTIFPAVTQRSIYYLLRKGEVIEEFKISKIQSKKGNYSWGQNAERIYYKLGPNANPKISQRAKKFFESRS